MSGSSSALTLRCKSKNGQHLMKGLTTQSTVADLQRLVAELTNIPKESQKILIGFPPHPIKFDGEAAPLNSLPICSGDTLVIEEDRSKTAAPAQVPAKRRTIPTSNSNFSLSGQGVMTRKVVPANNSCLFTAIGFVMEGGVMDLSRATQMRNLIADVVAADSALYNEALLGKSNAEYCAWILNSESWGGAIEVSILSKVYETEIDVVDIQSCRIDRFGEDSRYDQRVLLLYDGIHYDALYLEALDPNLPPKTIFPTTDDSILALAQEFATEARSQRQFTDVSGFTLRCLVCNTCLTGQKQAQEHATQTGHINFGEV